MQQSSESSETPPPSDPNQEVDEDGLELEEADLVREASVLDDLAKLITVEEVGAPPPPGLCCLDSLLPCPDL